MNRDTVSEAENDPRNGSAAPGGLSALTGAADRLCRQQFGDGVFIRGIVEFSNVCARVFIAGFAAAAAMSTGM